MINNKRDKKPTVTVAVCAYNEQYNIGPFLKSVLQQKIEGFVLDRFLVISDGSTDDTVKVIKAMKNSQITLRNHSNRIGKSSRLNEIFADLKSDYLVLADADVIFASKDVISNLVKPLADPKVGLSGGHPMPMKAKTFIEKAVNCSLEVYIPIRKALNNGDNVLSATGRIMALRRELAKKIKVPVNTISNDGFTYFSCLSFGYKYKYSPDAPVYFRSPQSLYDHLNQSTRFAATHAFMKKYFPADMVDREYFIPQLLLLKSMLIQFLKHPVLSLTIFVLNKYCAIKAHLTLDKINALWEVVYSTKKLNTAK